MEKPLEQFLNPNSMLTPGIVGGVVMMLTNTIAFQFDVPHKWVGLFLSFSVGLLLVINATFPIWQRLAYYVLNSLIVFSMAVGAASITSAPPRSTPVAPTPVAQTVPAAVPGQSIARVSVNVEHR